ncbi:MAG: hypothetical protein KDI01_00590 [Halioglobus sp.]|nr:hypothetical protein [Halioglobus sp.]
METLVNYDGDGPINAFRCVAWGYCYGWCTEEHLAYARTYCYHIGPDGPTKIQRLVLVQTELRAPPCGAS